MARFGMGVDLGNGHVKARSDYKTINLPSAYARPEEFGEDVIGSKAFDINVYKTNKYDGESFVWGADVLKANNNIATFTYEDRYTQKAYKVLSQITLAALIPDDASIVDNILVVTGCPSREKGTQFEEAIVNNYKAAHSIIIDGKPVMVRVTDVIVLPQPLGTVLNEYLDDDGYVRDGDYERDYIGVIDVGSGTTDGDGIKALKRQTDDMFTLQRGMIWAYQQIAKWINRKEPRMDADYKEVERQILNGNDEYVKSKRMSISIKEIKAEIFTKLSEDLVTEVTNHWGDPSKFDRIILTGGGSRVKELVDAFRAWKDDIIVVKDGQMSNANGFYKYAKFKLQD